MQDLLRDLHSLPIKFPHVSGFQPVHPEKSVQPPSTGQHTVRFTVLFCATLPYAASQVSLPLQVELAPLHAP